MRLNQFPEAIAQARVNLLVRQQEVWRLKDALSAFEREIDGAIAFDADLKNETQRKFRRAELQSEEEYQGLLLQARAAEASQAEAEIALELLKNQFSVAKLGLHEAILKIL